MAAVALALAAELVSGGSLAFVVGGDGLGFP